MCVCVCVCVCVQPYLSIWIEFESFVDIKQAYNVIQKVCAIVIGIVLMP